MFLTLIFLSLLSFLTDLAILGWILLIPIPIPLLLPILAIPIHKILQQTLLSPVSPKLPHSIDQNLINIVGVSIFVEPLHKVLDIRDCGSESGLA